MNKKIKNAEEVNIDGFVFRSKLEYRFYLLLKEMGISVTHEPKFKIWSRESFKVPFFDRWGKKFSLLKRKPTAITYSPDFVFNYKGITVYLEIKGFKNDVANFKIKLFRDFLEEMYKGNENKAVYAVVYNKFEFKQLINYLDEITL